MIRSWAFNLYFYALTVLAALVGGVVWLQAHVYPFTELVVHAPAAATTTH